MDISLGQVWPVIGIVLTGVGTYVLPTIAYKVNQILHIKTNSQAAEVIDSAIYRGAEIVMHSLSTIAKENQTLDIKNVAIAEAVQLTLKLAPQAFKALGITEQEVVQLLGARVNTLINAIPTIQPKEDTHA
jgi:hypothetical protein